jgi:2-oxoglutarate ferredoxin oxidoreductase subunit alpha
VTGSPDDRVPRQRPVDAAPNFPAEIRAPQGTCRRLELPAALRRPRRLTPGDSPDVLVAMNPAALKANLKPTCRAARRSSSTPTSSPPQPRQGGYDVQPPRRRQLCESYHVHATCRSRRSPSRLPKEFVDPQGQGARAKNMFALGLLSWMYTRPTEADRAVPEAQFAKKPDILAPTSPLQGRLQLRRDDRGLRAHLRGVAGADAPAPTATSPATWRLSYGLVAAACAPACRSFSAPTRSRRPPTSCTRCPGSSASASRRSRPRTRSPASASALGASFGGALGVTSTSGPGLALKSEAIGLAVIARAAARRRRRPARRPSTGLPTKTEQADLLQAMFGRNGESPVPIVAPQSPGDCFDAPSRRAGSRRHTGLRSSCCPTATSPTAPSRGGCPTSDLPDLTRRSHDRAQRGRRRRTRFQPYARPRDAGPAVGDPGTPGSSTASAASRRPTSPATSPTTPTTTS